MVSNNDDVGRWECVGFLLSLRVFPLQHKQHNKFGKYDRYRSELKILCFFTFLLTPLFFLRKLIQPKKRKHKTNKQMGYRV